MTVRFVEQRYVDWELLVARPPRGWLEEPEAVIESVTIHTFLGDDYRSLTSWEQILSSRRKLKLSPGECWEIRPNRFA